VKDIDLLSIALSSAASPLRVLAAGFESMRIGVNITRALVGWTQDLIRDIGKLADKVSAAFTGVDWKAIGFEVVKGLASGLVDPGLIGASALKLAETIKNKFTGALEIHSPSRVFERYGQQTTEGYTRGVVGSSGATQDAVDAMAPGAPTAVARASSSSAGPIELHIHLHAEAGASPETVKALQSPSLMAELTKTLEAALAQSGAFAGGA
jgi:hypothetical protein